MKSCEFVGGKMISGMIRKSYQKIPYIEDFRHKVLQSTTLQKFKYMQINPSESTHQVYRNNQNQESYTIQSIGQYVLVQTNKQTNKQTNQKVAV